MGAAFFFACLFCYVHAIAACIHIFTYIDLVIYCIQCGRPLPRDAEICIYIYKYTLMLAVQPWFTVGNYHGNLRGQTKGYLPEELRA